MASVRVRFSPGFPREQSHHSWGKNRFSAELIAPEWFCELRCSIPRRTASDVGAASAEMSRRRNPAPERNPGLKRTRIGASLKKFIVNKRDPECFKIQFYSTELSVGHPVRLSL
jgi:hypothetical protein